MRKLRVFFDLDWTMYDTNAMFDPIFDSMVAHGRSPKDVTRTLAAAVEQGYSFETHLRLLDYPLEQTATLARRYYKRLAYGDPFVYPGVVPMLEDLRARDIPCELVTFGYPAFQIAKFTGAPSLYPFFVACHFLWKGGPKADTVVARTQPDEQAVFVDDSSGYHQHPSLARVTRIRMHWPQNKEYRPHPKDGVDWLVIGSAEELLRKILDCRG